MVDVAKIRPEQVIGIVLVGKLVNRHPKSIHRLLSAGKFPKPLMPVNGRGPLEWRAKTIFDFNAARETATAA